MKSNLLSQDLAEIIVKCIEDATGDVIKEDLAHSELIYQNSTSHRIWDHLFSLLTKRLDSQGYSVFSSNSGPWRFPIIYDSSTGNIITVMRETRFSQLQHNQKKRNKPHYVDLLAAAFNADLLPQFQQMTFLENPHQDLNEIQARINLILRNFSESTNLVQNHVLVLFDASDYTLYNVRAVMVTPSLEVSKDGEFNLSHLISAKPSIIIDKVDNPSSLANNPTKNLKLKERAIQRKADVEFKKNNADAKAN